jgi:hypothetical protein
MFDRKFFLFCLIAFIILILVSLRYRNPFVFINFDRLGQKTEQRAVPAP